LRFLLALLLAVLCIPASAASPEQIAGELFRDVLQRDDLAHLSRVTEGDPRLQSELREAIETLDCISVHRIAAFAESASDDRVSARLELHATGALKADWRPMRPLPGTWFVEIRKRGSGWRIERAMTAERRVALAMAEAGSADEARRLLFDAADADRARVLSLYVTEPAVASRFDLLDAAWSVAQALGDLPAEMKVRRQRALALVGTKPQEAVAAAIELEQFADAYGGPDDVALAALTLGMAHSRMGALDLALEKYAAAAALADRCNDPIVALKCLYMAAKTQSRMEKHRDVLATIDRLTPLVRHYGWEEGEENALTLKATTHLELGNPEFAREAYEEVIRIGTARGQSVALPYAKHNLAGILLGEKKWDEAIRLEREAMQSTTDRNALPHMSGRIVTALTHKGALDEAEAELRRCEAMPRGDDAGLNRHHEAALAIQWSELRQAQGRNDEAIAQARQVILSEDAWVRENTNLQWLAQVALGKALGGAGRLDEAIAAYREGIELAESRRFAESIDPLSRAASYEQNLFRYVELIDLLIEKNAVEEALRIADRMKGGALRDVLARTRVDPAVAMTAEERARAKSLGQTLVDLNRQVIGARARGQAVETSTKRLAAARRELDAFQAEMLVKYPAAVHRRIDDAGAMAPPAGLTVLEYVVGENGSLVFVVTGKSVEAIRLPIKAADVEAEAKTMARLIASRSPRYRAVAQRLYAELLGPVERFLQGGNAICVIPDGALWTVPFHALVSGDGTHLIERHAVFYAHALALMDWAAEPPPREAPPLIAFGNPTVGSSARSTIRSMFRGAAFGSLIDAESEVRALASMYSPARSRVYFRDAAQERAFKSEAPGYGVIHVAAHAFVDQGSPMHSAIALAASSADEDGLLEAREVVELPLHAQLAVLSACESAGTHAGRGEGILGLSWAFAAAGCPTTVASQWSAESKATSRLMIELHRHLLAGETTAEALRAAQLSLRKSKEWRHPFYWAPFVAIGAAHRPVAQLPPSTASR